MVHPRPLDRDVSGRDEGGGGGRARDRHSRLFTREPDRDDARAGNGGARQMHRKSTRVPGFSVRRSTAGATAKSIVIPGQPSAGMGPWVRLILCADASTELTV